jgi:hypothetical protein
MTCPPLCARLLRCFARHRRLLLILVAVSLVMYAIGYFTPTQTSPLMCKIYG